jgi:AraC-like DNA-binding protein/ligand-binding sensor protein
MNQATEFDRLCESPGLREILELTWRLFRVNLGLVSPDGERAICHDSTNRSAPFCRALQQHQLGSRLCLECDRRFFRRALQESKPLRYRCHAGLTEFIVPVIRQGQVVALLQCGQILDSKPSRTEWEAIRERQSEAGLDADTLQRFFYLNPVLPSHRQADLLTFLDIVAGFLASTECPLLRTSEDRIQEKVGRIMTYIEGRLAEELTLPGIARAVGLSCRTLSRWFPKQTGMTVLDFIAKRRIALACHYLASSDRTCAEVAFAAGFQSVQNFNRKFRGLKGISPREWKEQWLASPAPSGERKLRRTPSGSVGACPDPFPS